MVNSLKPHEPQHARPPCSSPKPMSIESVMLFKHLILCRPLLLLPSIFPSIRVFSNESALRIRWPKYWSFSFNIRPSNEYSGLISQRSKPVLPHCRQVLYQLSYKGRPKILEWVAYPFSRGSSRQRNQTRVSCLAGGFFTTGEAQPKGNHS